MKTEVGGCIALPPEIRDRIYRYLLGPPGTPIAHRIVPKFFYKPVDNLYWIESRSFEEEAKFPDYCQFEPSCLSILLVSKQTYAEAFHLFYCANLFEFQDTADLFRFLKIIGYARRQHLKMIRFDWHGPQAKEAFRLLKTCQWLEVVHFTVPCSHPPGYAALKEVRGLKIARAEAMVHYNRDPNHCYIHFGDYHCHCRCRKDGDLLSDLKELETAMMRHRLKKYAPKEEEKINLFKAKRENFKKSEDDLLVEGKASFDQQWRRLEERVWRSTHAT
ncbi:hypothetical protein MMC28_010530 [Mycoblastus sanguinarius]|nr:hypothetical protein [Mycoblastus sanguinarius]